MSASFYLLICTIILNISTLKDHEQSIKEEIIINSVSDFEKIGQLYKKGRVFHVSYYDSVYRKTFSNTKGWVYDKFYSGMVGVTIFPSDVEYLIHPTDTIGSKGGLPSRFIEKNGKLFYWFDNTFPLSKEALNVFKKYGIVNTGKASMGSFNDSQKGADYFVCKVNPLVYKRVITSRGFGYYDIPDVRCSTR